MKKVLLITLSLLLAACGVVQPVQQEQPTPIIQTVSVVQTVEVVQTVPVVQTVVITSVPPTDAPTVPPAPTEAAPTAAPVTDNTGLTPVVVPNDLGKGVFANITFSSGILTLNCTPREFEITMDALLPDIKRVEMYYRIVDQPSALYPSEWKLVGNLGTDGTTKYFTTFTALQINPNFRGLDKAWIEFQFVGLNKGGGVVDRTQKIEKLITYYKNCP